MRRFLLWLNEPPTSFAIWGYSIALVALFAAIILTAAGGSG